MMHKKTLVAVLVPFVLLCLLIIRAEITLSKGQEWQFQVQGYDPRDLLRGHYLRFRVDYNWETSNMCSDANDCCLCLTDTGALVPKVKRVSCEIAKNQCDGYMRSEFENSLNRYYIAENQAARAEQILREAQADNAAFITLSINRKGEPLIKDMILHGESLENLIKQQ